MEMPLLLPPSFDAYRKAQSDEELARMLIQHKNDLISFFGYAADHETWSETHATFMRMVLDFLTNQFSQNRLSADEVQSIASIVQAHILILSGYLPQTIKFDVSGMTFSSNSLMFGAASPQMQELIVQDSRDQEGTKAIKLSGIDPGIFRIIEEFVMTGAVADLWKMQETELTKIHRQATTWGFQGLAHQAEEILARYIMRGNVFEKLLEAHKHNWPLMKKACRTFINQLDLGCRLHETKEAFFAFEFFEFSTPALDIFEKLSQITTHLIFRKKLIEEMPFRAVVNQCPQLVGLDISESLAYDENLQSDPKTILELDLSSCTWLESSYIPLLAKAFPSLKKLVIQNNSQLTYASWAELRLFSELTYLDISRNTQISDDDLRMVLQALPKLTDLKMDECKQVTDRGFFELAHLLPDLTVLSMERCQLSDGLLKELAQRCQQLKELNVCRCPRLTERGILEAVKQALSLRRLRADIDGETAKKLPAQIDLLNYSG